jgi:hypothetical protein
MYRKFVLSLCLILFFSVTAVVAKDNGSNGLNGPNASHGSNEPNVPNASGESNGSDDPEAKTVKGMSVLGNNEAPMSLFIVPWKSSELGVEANLNRTLNERDVPVDRDVFLREVDFYQVSVASKTATPAAVSHVVKAR